MFGSEPPWKTSGVKALVSAGLHEGSPSHLLPTVKGKKPTSVTLRQTEILVWMLGRRQQRQTLAFSFLTTEGGPLGSVLFSPWLTDKFRACHKLQCCSRCNRVWKCMAHIWWCLYGK